MALTDNLVSYYKMEGNSNDSVGSNNGTDTSVTYSAGNGKIGEGAGFASSSTIIYPAQTDPTTISFWIKITTIASKSIFLSSSPDNAIGGRSTDKIQLYDGTDRIASNNWIKSVRTHYCFVYIGSAYAIYQNGSFLENLTCNKLQIRQIGRSASNGFTGEIDEVGFWSRALSASEVTELYNAGAGLTYPFVSNQANFLAFF